MPKNSKVLVYELVQGLIKVPKADIRERIAIIDWEKLSPAFRPVLDLSHSLNAYHNKVIISWLPVTFLTATCVIRRFAETFVPIWLVYTCSPISTRLTNAVINGMLAIGSSIPSRTLTSVWPQPVHACSTVLAWIGSTIVDIELAIRTRVTCLALTLVCV